MEEVDGVRVVRAPVALRISKGVIMPTFGYLAWKYVREADVISLHLPQFDTAGVALRGNSFANPRCSPITATWSCLGLFNRLSTK